jgi:hypothetical protein
VTGPSSNKFHSAVRRRKRTNANVASVPFPQSTAARPLKHCAWNYGTETNLVKGLVLGFLSTRLPGGCRVP